MEVKQIYTLTNEIVKEVLGKEDLVKEDLSNLVDVGTELFNANAVDNYVKTLVDHIGKMVFVSRQYQGSAPSVLMDAWEFGTVLEKVSGDMPTYVENESWKLEDGTSYDPNVFYKPSVSVKFFNSKTTFEVDLSITQKQVASAFSNAVQMNSFISMLFTLVENALTTAYSNLILRTINNFTAETIYTDYQYRGTLGDLTAKSGIRAVNLLKLYNDATGESLTVDDCLKDIDFLKFATMEISLYIKRLSSLSTLFNIGGKQRFTPRDMLHVVMLENFKASADTYLQSDTFHNEYVALPNAETVAYWQGTGKDYSFDSVSKIQVKTADKHDVTASGILCVMFDRDALGVSNVDRRVTNNWNPKAEFWNYFYKSDASYFNDFNENFVVFFVA